MSQPTTFDESIPVRGFVDENGVARTEVIGNERPERDNDSQPARDNDSRSERDDNREPQRDDNRDRDENRDRDNDRDRESGQDRESDDGQMRIQPVGGPSPVDVPEQRAPEQKLVVDEQDWSKYSHEELYMAVHDKNDPGQVSEISAEWEKFRNELTEAAREISEAVTAAESGWTGATAATARNGMRQLAEWVSQTAETVVKMADQVQQQANIMATARASMPEPNNFDYEQAAKSFSGGSIADFMGTTEDTSTARNQAVGGREQALAVVKSMEQQSMAVDATTPSFAPPFNPTTGKIENPAPLMAAQGSGSGGYDSTSAAAYGAGGAFGAGGGKKKSGGKFGRGKGDGKASFGPGLDGSTKFEGKNSKKKTKDGKNKGDDCNPKQLKGELDPKPDDKKTAPAGAGGGRGGGGGGGGGFGGGGGGGGGSFGQSAAPAPPQTSPGGRIAASGVMPTAPVPQPIGGGGGGAAAGAGAGAPFGGAPMGAPPPGAGAGGQNQQDGERKNKYALTEDIFDLPGGELPPSVIGEVAQPKRKMKVADE